MKKNGFIMSTYVYILLVFFLLLLGTMLVVLNNTRLLANKIKENTDSNIDFNLVLKGDKEIIITKDSEYIELGCIATTFNGEKLDVNVMGEVNTKKIGVYDIEYSAEYKGVEKKVKRKVNVVNVGENLVTYITNLYEDSATRESNGLKKDNTRDQNIRYYGSNPNNYVSFNNELWRIIGVFGNNVKLVRKDSLGELSWDSSKSGVNSGYGINQWGESTYAGGTPYEGADLMLYLNKMYYGGETVTCYGGSNNATVTCPTGTLNDESKILIDNHTWNTGAIEYAIRTDTLAFYNAERGTKTGKICTSGNSCTDTVNRTVIWTGYVALPYVTDWAYASSEADCETNMQKQDGSYNYICKNNNWMNRSGNTWYFSPYVQSSLAHSVWYVDCDMFAFNRNAYFSFGFAPALYLKSNVFIVNGNGTEDTPYELKLGN